MKVFDVERAVNVSQRLLVEAPSSRSPSPEDLDNERHESRDRRRVRHVPVVPSKRHSPRFPFFSFPIHHQAPSFLVVYKAVHVKIPCGVDVYDVGGEAVGAAAYDIRHAPVFCCTRRCCIPVVILGGTTILLRENIQEPGSEF